MSPFITWAIWTKDHTAITNKIRPAEVSELDLILGRPNDLEAEATVNVEVLAGDPDGTRRKQED
jgi:hypothetical protein